MGNPQIALLNPHRFSYGSIVAKWLRARARGCHRCHCCHCANIALACPCVVVEWVRGEGEGCCCCCCCCCRCVDTMSSLLSVSPCPRVIVKWVRGEGEGHHYLHHHCHHSCIDVVICIAMPSCHCEVGKVRVRGHHRGCH